MPRAVINGSMLHYEVRGKGVPIMFIHPPLLSGEVFRYQQAQLAGECSVITLDIRGHGRSERSGAPLTYALVAQDIVGLLDHLGLSKVFLCGYSTGGAIALEAMLAYPDRFEGGILVSAMSETSDAVIRARQRLAVAFASIRPMVPLLLKAISWGHADCMATYRRLVRESRMGYVPDMRRLYHYSVRYNCTERLTALRLPVLLLYGSKDRSLTRYRELLERSLADVETHLLGDGNRQLPTKSHRLMNGLIRRWIREQTEGEKPVREQKKQAVSEWARTSWERDWSLPAVGAASLPAVADSQWDEQPLTALFGGEEEVEPQELQ